MNSLFYTWIPFFTHEFTFVHMNSLLYTWIHFFAHKFTFFTWIHFFTHEYTFLKKLISFWNSLFHLRMIWLVWHTYRFFFQINFILKFTFSSSNDLISVTDGQTDGWTYIHTYRKWLLNVLSDVKIDWYQKKQKSIILDLQNFLNHTWNSKIKLRLYF